MKPAAQVAADGFAALDQLATMVAVVAHDGACRRANAALEDQTGMARRALERGRVQDWLTHPQQMADTLAAVAATWWVGAAFALLVATALVVRYRRYVFTMPLKIAAVILALHVFRLIVGQAVQILQWEVGAPEGAIEAWFTLSAASIVANRIPLLPGRDLLFVSAGVALSQSLEVGSAAVSGMLLVNAVLAKVLSFGLFVGLGMVERKQAPAGPAGEGAALSDPAAEGPTPAADNSDGASAPP